MPSGGLTFADVARASGAEPPGNWRDIMALPASAQASEVKKAARAVWLYMSNRARRGENGFAEAAIVQEGEAYREKYGWARPDETSSLPGYRWDGIFTNVYTDLWPSLHGLLGSKNKNKTKDQVLAADFRIKVSAFLKHAQNVVCIYNGGLDPSTGSPQWFIRGEWNDDPVPFTPLKVREATRAESRLTPEQAGETREPEPVSTGWACRIARCLYVGTFKDQGQRDAHERHDWHDDGWRCRDSTCARELAPFSSQTNRNAHERNVHPGNHDLLPFECASCHERYQTQRGLAEHERNAHLRPPEPPVPAPEAEAPEAEAPETVPDPDPQDQEEAAASPSPPAPVPAPQAQPPAPVPAAETGSLSGMVRAMENDNRLLRSGNDALSAQVAALAEENARLRDDLAAAGSSEEVTRLAGALAVAEAQLAEYQAAAALLASLGLRPGKEPE
jgi:hypothetical protein